MAPGINLVMTIIGFTVSTMFIIFVCTRLIFARIHYISSRRAFRLSSRSDLSALERGVEPLVLANFPTKKYHDPFFSCAIDTRCTVCLSEFRADDTLRILPLCGHFFHSTCIDIWLQQNCTCPVCRVSLRELSESMPSLAAHFLARSQDNRRISTNSGDRIPATENEPAGAENNFILNESGSERRDVGNKQDESPSNA